MATEALEPGCLTFGDFTIDRADERLLGPSGPVRLGNKAYRVLLMLAEQQGRLLTKDALFSSVWDGAIVSESALTSVVKELRRALGDESRPPRYIESVYGRGYRLLPEVTAADVPGSSHSETGPPTPAKSATPPLLLVPEFDGEAVRDSHPHLAGALREEILLALSRFRDIRLVSAGEAAEARYAGERGNRDYQLSLKLVPGRESVRAFVRLSRLGTQAILWADQVDLPADTPGADVDRLIRSIVSAALPRMHDDLLCNPAPQAGDVYDLYFAARLKMRAMLSFAEAREVAAAWEQLIEKHPDFAPAYPPLVRLLDTDYCFTGIGSTGKRERALAYQLAHRAIIIDPTEPQLHSMKGWVHLWAGEPSLAREHLEVALDVNPWNQRALVELATAFLYLDDLNRASALLERCRDLTPFATEAPHEEQGLLHLLRGEFELASAEFALVRRHHPDDAARAAPTITSELYALLAAAGAGASDLATRSRNWRASMIERWCAPEAPTDDQLVDWVSFHEPLQDPGRKDWLLQLLRRALQASAPLPDPEPASRRTSSTPLPADPPVTAGLPPAPH